MIVHFEGRGENAKAVNAAHKRSYAMLAGLMGCILYGLYYAQALYLTDTINVPYPAGDLAYYCRLARHLYQYGVENQLVDLPAMMQGGSELYHWGDIWGIAMVSHMTGLQEEQAMIMIIYPVFTGVLVMGLWSLFERHWTRGRWGLLIFCILAPFASDFDGFLPAGVHRLTNLFVTPIIQFPKLIVPAILLVWLLRLVDFQDKRAFYLAAMVSGLLFVNALPAIGLWGAVTFARSTHKGVVPAKTYLFLFLASALVLINCAWLYLFDGDSGVYIPPTKTNVIGNIPYRAHIIFQGLVQSMTLLPYLGILGMFYGWQKFKNGQGGYVQFPGHMSFLLLPVFGLAGWGLFYHTSTDSVQFFQNILHACLPILVAWCGTLYFNTKNGLPFGILLCVLLLFSIRQNMVFSRFKHVTGRVNKSDYNRVREFMATDAAIGDIRCVSYLADKDSSALMANYTTAFYPMEFISLIDRSYTVYSLNTIYYPDTIKSPYVVRTKWLSPLMQYFHLQGDGAAIDKVQLSFIRATKSRYLISRAGLNVPDYIRPLLGQDSIVLATKPFIIYRIIQEGRKRPE
jgi:hypothetical protein